MTPSVTWKPISRVSKPRAPPPAWPRNRSTRNRRNSWQAPRRRFLYCRRRRNWPRTRSAAQIRAEADYYESLVALDLAEGTILREEQHRARREVLGTGVHPEFIRLGPLDIHTYGVFVAIGFIVGLAVATRRARRDGIDPERIADLGMWLIISGMLGGKLFHIIFFWNDFIYGWHAEGVRSLRQGFVFYGGFISGVSHGGGLHQPEAAAVGQDGRYLRAIGRAGTRAFGRMGCFFNGCCYGRPCSLPWAVTFPPPHVMAGIPVHPTEIYEALGNLMIFAGTHRVLPAQTLRRPGVVVVCVGVLAFCGLLWSFSAASFTTRTISVTSEHRAIDCHADDRGGGSGPGGVSSSRESWCTA